MVLLLQTWLVLTVALLAVLVLVVSVQALRRLVRRPAPPAPPAPQELRLPQQRSVSPDAEASRALQLIRS